MKTTTIAIIAGLIGLPLLFMHTARANINYTTQARSDLQEDELSLASDMKLLRRDLRRGAGMIVVVKERNFVRQDLLNIVMDRWRPAEELEYLDRDQDLASVIGEWFAVPARELSQNPIPPSHS